MGLLLSSDLPAAVKCDGSSVLELFLNNRWLLPGFCLLNVLEQRLLSCLASLVRGRAAVVSDVGELDLEFEESDVILD